MIAKVLVTVVTLILRPTLWLIRKWDDRSQRQEQRSY